MSECIVPRCRPLRIYPCVLVLFVVRALEPIGAGLSGSDPNLDRRGAMAMTLELSAAQHETWSTSALRTPDDHVPYRYAISSFDYLLSSDRLLSES